jgi:hypothetical protein
MAASMWPSDPPTSTIVPAFEKSQATATAAFSVLQNARHCFPEDARLLGVLSEVVEDPHAAGALERGPTGLDTLQDVAPGLLVVVLDHHRESVHRVRAVTCGLAPESQA